MNLRDIGEFGFIDRIAARVTGRQGVILGIGDDAAILLPTPGHVTLATSDMLVEGIHFDLAYTDPFRLGRKSLAVNLSDIAAMGAKPLHALLSLAIPRDLPVEFLDRFLEGFLAIAAEFGVVLVGGDTCASAAGLTISVTVTGEQLPEKVVRRSGARPGDLVFVTGTLGDSALGLELLRQGAGQEEAVGRHLDPAPRVREGLALADAALPSAMIDVSDGLLADLGHILRLSGAGARIELEKIPRSPFLCSRVAASDDPYLLSLSGGEDYELLLTAPSAAGRRVTELAAGCGTPVTVIGEIVASPQLTIVAPDGSDYRPPRLGYNHFSKN